MTTIKYTNHQKRQLVYFLKKYPRLIFVTNCLECRFQKFTLEYNQKYQCLDNEVQ